MQVLELTKLIDEDPLWKYPEATDVTEVRDPANFLSYSCLFVQRVRLANISCMVEAMLRAARDILQANENACLRSR
jgi:hypothetical protein